MSLKFAAVVATFAAATLPAGAHAAGFAPVDDSAVSAVDAAVASTTTPNLAAEIFVASKPYIDPLRVNFYDSLTRANFQVAKDDIPIILVPQELDAVPEPATWAMMIAGFGLIGGVMRRRSLQVRYAA